MKKSLYILFLFVQFNLAQNTIETNFIRKIPLQVDQLVSVDNFQTLFYLENNVIHKKNSKIDYTYNNLQLGTATSANAFNPLKINLFYQDLNTVIILDNRLAEIFKINFNSISTYKNVSHVSTGNDNTIWIYNQDSNELEVYDYLNNKTRVKTIPISETVLDLTSNFNYCWLLTDQQIYSYNYFGSLLYKIPNTGYSNIAESNENLVLQKENTLFYLEKKSNTIQEIDIDELLIKQFSLTNESLYIYDGDFLHEYQIKTN